MNIAIIAASGQGTRFGAPGGKQFAQVAGKPLVGWTLETFLAHDDIDAVVCVINEQDEQRYRDLVATLRVSKTILSCHGGAERVESVWNGLVAAREWCGSAFDEAIVLVHDGARPLVSHALVSRVIAAARARGAAVPVVPIADTVKEVENGEVVRTLDRSRLRAVQTPQGFRANILYDAYERARAEGWLSGMLTDDAAVVEKAGAAVAVVEGERHNIKVTTPDDAMLIELILKEKHR